MPAQASFLVAVRWAWAVMHMTAAERAGETADGARVRAKVEALPRERISPSSGPPEFEDFVDFLRAREDDQRLTHAAAKASEASFAKVWDNDADAAYDRM